MGKESISLSCANDSVLDFMHVARLLCVYVWPHVVKQKDCVVLKHTKLPIEK